MPKIEIDYSNTIFYKIFCKDDTIKDVYVGLTTNFVQRKHAHKQCCKNEKGINYNCKLYNTIRKNGGWDNWQMEIIAFHNCKDSHDAHKKEQEYFEMLGATLNSIEPLPKPKIKNTIKNKEEKIILFCEHCNINFSHWKSQEIHNTTNKHIKMMSTFNNNNKVLPTIPKIFNCEVCDFKCFKQSNWIEHVNTIKHLHNHNGNKTDSLEITKNVEYNCACGKKYISSSGLWKHKKNCNILSEDKPENTPVNMTEPKEKQNDWIIMLIKENEKIIKENLELKNTINQQNLIIEVFKNGTQI